MRPSRNYWLTPNPTASYRIELMQWAQRVNMQLAAALVGLDHGRTPAGAEQLAGLLEGKSVPGEPKDGMESGGFDNPKTHVYQEFVETFYGPARQRRELLWQQVLGGELEEDDLPQDAIMLMVKGADPAWDDPDLAIREAAFLTPAAYITTARGTIWTLDELFVWFDQHPEDWERRFDSAFLVGAANEALRLHPVVPVLPPRVALEDVALSKGTEIPAGEAVVAVMGPANLDPEIFGADAHCFNPYRQVPKGVLPYGTAFGAGPHLCYGLPVVMGSPSIDGNLVHILKLLFENGVQIDSSRSFLRPHAKRGQFDIRGLAGRNAPGEGVPNLYDSGEYYVIFER